MPADSNRVDVQVFRNLLDRQHLAKLALNNRIHGMP